MNALTNPEPRHLTRLRVRARRAHRIVSHFAAARRDAARALVHLFIGLASVFVEAADLLPDDIA